MYYHEPSTKVLYFFIYFSFKSKKAKHMKIHVKSLPMEHESYSNDFYKYSMIDVSSYLEYIVHYIATNDIHCPIFECFF